MDAFWCAPCAPTNYNNTGTVTETPVTGALRAHQRITTSVNRVFWCRILRCAPCAPTNYNCETRHIFAAATGAPRAHQQITTPFPPECRPYGFWVRIKRTHELQLLLHRSVRGLLRVRSVRTNELQRALSVENHSVPKGAPCARPRITTSLVTTTTTLVLGALRVHQRITTLKGWGSAAAPPGVLRTHQRITTVISLPSPTCWAGCASCAPTNYNTRFWNSFRQVFWVRLVRTNELQHHACHPAQKQSGCAPCAPTNYNMYEVFKTPARLRGALRAHQRITTSIEKAQQTPAQGCAPCTPTNYNRKFISVIL